MSKYQTHRIQRPRGGRWAARCSGVILLLAACSSAQPELPPPRPIVIYSGARLRLDHDRAREINEWMSREQRNIEDDPSFLVETRLVVTEEVYIWDDMVIEGDTVRVPVSPRALDSQLVHMIYGHLHPMVRMGRQEEWLPEAPDAVGYDLERAIVSRAADAWLLGRTVWDTAPYGPLDELAYAAEAGYLDAFIFTARPDEFASARTRWARADPGREDEYQEWFRETFSKEPPGLRAR